MSVSAVGRSERWVAVFSGGGTGGHLYPAIALAGALVEERPDVHPFFIGAGRGLEARVLPGRGVDHLLVPVEGFRRGALLANLSVLANLLKALARVAEAFRTLRPRLVVVTGGYAGGPAGLMAGLMGVPLVLQEQNSVPGLTTRGLALMAREVHLAYPEAVDQLPRPARRRARVTGNPVQPPERVDGLKAARSFGLDPRRPIVLVVGGSQGARAINEALLEAIAHVAEGRSGARRSMTGKEERPVPDLQILWSTGPAHLDGVQETLRRLGDPEWVRPTGYIEEMSRALGIADVAVSRAGAMATSEFLAWGLPAILIPLPHAAADHQRKNADALARAGAAVMLAEEELTGRALWAAIAELVGDQALRSRMSRSARSRGKPDAAREIATSLVRFLPPPADPTEAP